MNHKIANIQNLYDDSRMLLNSVVRSSTDDMLKDIENAVNNLKNTWKGKDAGVQIMNVITTYNSLVKVRNSLSHIASDCMEISAKYRGVQIANGAALEQFSVSRLDDMVTVADYYDNTDTISILPEADSARVSLQTAVSKMEKLLSLVREFQDRIFNNWVSGGNTRDEAFSVFESFVKTANVYSNTLTDCANSVKTALTNYNF